VGLVQDLPPLTSNNNAFLFSMEHLNIPTGSGCAKVPSV
jgi:hypothetical protein